MIEITHNLSSKKKNKKNFSNDRSIMPRAVATWLIDNTSLTFPQVAAFCGLHYLEIKLIADKEDDVDIQGCNPIEIGQITEEEIKNCESDPSRTPQLSSVLHDYISKSKSYYTSAKKSSNRIKKSSDKPDAILWLIKHYPKISDKQITKLIKTTESTIISIRNKTHWKIDSLKPRDPVLLRLCTQDQLDYIEQDVKITEME
ncbi:cell cycle transcriptional regulator TrcR [Candidatus Mesenet endosymbiont of Agriotes lineatus]|uniref:cell cycle transcriptional regulator TrcR n=1 Tax=Candidatus Mesenet endosymbiont of Agriotes lineatus TaxID=3077948 RepID=UPI0030D5922B